MVTPLGASVLLVGLTEIRRNRFDAPNAEYRICYCGESPDAAFAETFLRRPPVRVIALAQIAQRTLSYLCVLRPLRLVALHGPGLARAGVAGDITSGLDYERSNATALELWNHPERPDGIRYLCRHDSAEYAIALFDRNANSEPALETITSLPVETDIQQLAQWAEKYGFAVV